MRIPVHIQDADSHLQRTKDPTSSEMGFVGNSFFLFLYPYYYFSDPSFFFTRPRVSQKKARAVFDAQDYLTVIQYECSGNI